jgi:hypothetical protein
MQLKKELYFFVFLGLIILALFLRVYHLGQFSLFSDERSSVLLGVANTNQGGMGELMRPDKTFTPADFWAPRGIKSWLDADARGDVSGNSLVHDMMLKLFAWLFGKGDAAMRSVSVLFNMLTIWIMFRWARQFTKANVWTLAIVLFAAIEPFFVIYSQQARNYATSLFFTTASNYLFWLLVIKKEGQLNNNKKYLLLWVISSIGALFSTYLTALALVGQFIYMALFIRDRSIWLRMTTRMGLILIPFISWFVWGPARYFMGFQANAAEQLISYIQKNGEIPGWLEFASPSNLFKRTISIFSDHFFWTNDLYAKHGFKIGTVLLLFFLFLIFKWIKSLDRASRGVHVLGVIQIILPSVFLFAAAVNAGTTSGFFLRYACFGLPFGIFISVGVFDYILKQAIWYRIIACIFLLAQTYQLVGLFVPLYSDQHQKYTFSVGRGPNPYPMIAASIQARYQVGDTVVYPSSKANLLDSKYLRNLVIDPLDAQNVNLYLNETDSFIQRVDPFMQDSVLIKKANGKVLVIFDFKKGKYRY